MAESVMAEGYLEDHPGAKRPVRAFWNPDEI